MKLAKRPNPLQSLLNRNHILWPQKFRVACREHRLTVHGFPLRHKRLLLDTENKEADRSANTRPISLRVFLTSGKAIQINLFNCRRSFRPSACRLVQGAASPSRSLPGDQDARDGHAMSSISCKALPFTCISMRVWSETELTCG